MGTCEHGVSNIGGNFCNQCNGKSNREVEISTSEGPFKLVSSTLMEARDAERLAARVFIDASPCDPDITADQAKAWFRYKAARDRVDEMEKNNE